MQKQNRWFDFPFSSIPAAMPMAAALLALASVARGQIISFGQKPKVPVRISHPAAVPITLAGKKIAFQPSGTCAQQFADLVQQDFVRHGVTLVNRADLDAILAEHHFQASTSVDPATAVQLGKVSGANIMVTLNVTRCIASKRPVVYQDQMFGPRLNISRTEAHFMASIHIVDLATGRELDVHPIQTDPQKDNTAQAPTVAEYPSEFDVQDEAVKAAATQAHNLYFPWNETREVSFMNNKECNLKQAYEILKTGDLAGTLKLSRENVELCKSDSKPAHQADALYNLGVVYMLSGDYDNALATLTESQRVHADKATVDAISECRVARNGASATAARAAQARGEQRADQENQQKQEAQAAKATLTNDTVIKLVKGGLSDDVVVKMIAGQAAKFSLLPDDLLALKQAGVSDKVIAAMLDKK
jgi:hypothetical protein